MVRTIHLLQHIPSFGGAWGGIEPLIFLKRKYYISILIITLLGSIGLLSWGRSALSFAPIAKLVYRVAPPDTVKKAKPIEVEIDEETIPDSCNRGVSKGRTSPTQQSDTAEKCDDKDGYVILSFQEDKWFDTFSISFGIDLYRCQWIVLTNGKP